MTSIDPRLDRLPHKVAVPFRKLLEVGQLSNEVVATILDAGEQARDTSKLLGFATGYLYLQSKGVPIHDVVSMAKKQGRKINLSWSEARWRDEHERLSRVATLERLAGTNVEYPVSEVAALLPKRFPGYLIRSSRRLGMEGLRQRHCVADYHERILSGRSAIASVFADGKRWTVELVATGDNEAPLRMTQVKTRYNGLPSETIRKRIAKMLGIKSKPVPKSAPPGATESQPDHKENYRRVLVALRQHNVETVRVEFDGSGDSGSIEYVSFTPEIDAERIYLQFEQTNREWVEGRYLYTTVMQRVSLDKAINDVVYAWLNSTNVDWYNNDGGFGHCEINVQAGTIEMEVNTRYTESSCEYASRRDIETGEEI